MNRRRFLLGMFGAPVALAAPAQAMTVPPVGSLAYFDYAMWQVYTRSYEAWRSAPRGTFARREARWACVEAARSLGLTPARRAQLSPELQRYILEWHRVRFGTSS